MTIDTDRLPALATLVLGSGAHDSWADGACVLEAVAYIAGEPWSDHPDCASPILGAFLRSWNDALPDDERQTLKPYITRLVGSRGTTEQEDTRGWMALDWLVRQHTPAWLRLAGLTVQADRLSGLPEFKAGMDVAPLKPMLDAVRSDARAAGAAAWDAAGDAARDAARAAARDAAGAAAGAAARDAARAAAWAAARDAARAAAGAAARDAARDAAGAAAGDAAWAAARAALATTVTELQASAHQLIDRMLAVTEAT